MARLAALNSSTVGQAILPNAASFPKWGGQFWPQLAFEPALADLREIIPTA